MARFSKRSLFLSPGRQRKFAKPELAYGLAKGGQTDSQVAKRCKFHAYHWLMRFYNNRLLAINLCRLALGGQTVRNLRLLASKFELNQSPRKSKQVHARPRKSTQVHASGWPNETQVQNLRRLASPFGQGYARVCRKQLKGNRFIT